MNNSKLNMAIVRKLGLTILAPDVLSDGVWITMDAQPKQRLVDYCSHYNDIMPLVMKYRIDLYFLEELDDHIAEKMKFRTKPMVEFAVIHKNPPRAIAESLLKVLEAKYA